MVYHNLMGPPSYMQSVVDRNVIMPHMTVYVFAHCFIRDFWIVPCDLLLILPCTEVTVMMCYRRTCACGAHGPAATHRHALPRWQEQAPVHRVGPPFAIGCQMPSGQWQSGKKNVPCFTDHVGTATTCHLPVKSSLLAHFGHKICSDFTEPQCLVRYNFVTDHSTLKTSVLSYLCS